MSTLIYNDADADFSIVQTKRLPFIGYGNQGAAQAKNLRDSGVREILIGNREDAYKEPVEVFDRIAEQGLFGQLPLHSHTSQYGQLRALAADDGASLRERFERVLEDDILSGRFAREWSDVQAKGQERLEQLRAEALKSSIARAEAKVRNK